MPNDLDPCLLVMVADPAIRDHLVDWLLDYQDEMVFSAEAVDCYGIDPASLSLREQVSGRQGKLQVQIQCQLAEARALCSGLNRAFPGAAIRYWIQPVWEAGVVGHAS